jgi:hypothetical protein
VSTTEELLDRKSSGPGLESRECGRRETPRWTRCSLFPQKVGTNFADKRRRLVGIVRSRTQASEFVFVFICTLKFMTGLVGVIFKIRCNSPTE